MNNSLIIYQASNIHNLAFIVFTTIALFLCALMLLGGYFLGGKTYSRNKNTPFESGIQSVGDTHVRFAAKFYLVAMFFVIFDVESLFLYAWVISIRESGWIGFVEVMLFIIVLMISLLYLSRIGALNWSPLPRSYVNDKR